MEKHVLEENKYSDPKKAISIVIPNYECHNIQQSNNNNNNNDNNNENNANDNNNNNNN